jgi:integrase
MAVIRQRSNGWTYQISWYDENGKRHYKTKGGFKLRRDATAAAQEVELYHQKDGFQKEDTPLMLYIRKWYKLYKEPHIAERTKLSYLKSFAYIEQFFANKPMGSIDTDQVQEFINDLGKGKGVFRRHPHAKESVDKVRTHLSAVMKHAVHDGIYRYNPVEGTKITFANAAKSERDKFLNLDNQKKLSAYVLDNFTPKYFIYAFVYTGLNTGLRPGELFGLTWDHIDMKKEIIHVVQAWDYTTTYDFIPPKENHKRDVSITPKVVELLKELRKYQMAHLKNPRNFVFLTYLGKVPSPVTTGRQFKQLQSDSGIPVDDQISLHGMRHSHASLLLYQGVNIKSISERLGHKDIQTTMRVYAHVLDEMKHRDDALIQEILEKEFG